MSRTLFLAAAVLVLAGCGASDGDAAGEPAPKSSTAGAVSPSAASEAPTQSAENAIKAAAKAYSDAFLTGNGVDAYALLSERCKARNPGADFSNMVSLAATTYGEALPFDTFAADINGEQARVTYTYAASPDINQTDEPWVLEGGAWREDDC